MPIYLHIKNIFYWLKPVQVLSDNLPNKRTKLTLDLPSMQQGGLIVRCQLALDKPSGNEEKSTFLKKTPNYPHPPTPHPKQDKNKAKKNPKTKTKPYLAESCTVKLFFLSV